MIRTLANAQAVSHAAAEEFVRTGRDAIKAHGQFTVALAGGSTPRQLYELLSEDAFRTQLDWSAVEFFFGDERAVPPEHPDSNFRMAHDALLGKLEIRPDRIHRMQAERPDLPTAAANYQAEIARVCAVLVGDPAPALDMVLLGMGADGHTASLFPATAALNEKERWVVANHVPQLAINRMTLTPVILNRATYLLFLVVGTDKASALADVLEGPKEPLRLPSQLIRPTNGRLLWLADRAAASKLA
jgi:6-phosphogluconolactonase